MSLLRPGILQNSWSLPRLKSLFMWLARKAAKEGIPPENRNELDREFVNVGSIPHEGPINTLSEDRIPEFERGCQMLQSSIRHVGSLVGINELDLQRKIEIATNKDKKDLQRILTATQTVNPRPPPAQFELRDMDKPYEEPYLITSEHRTGAEVMYSIVQDPKLRNSDEKFIPDLWSRLENGDEESDNRLHWKYLPGPAKIEKSVRTLDYVNIAQRRDYMVASVKEDQVEIPVPIELPRFNEGACSSLGEHLANLLKPRQIEKARRIGAEAEVGLLGMTFDHSTFTPRENELFLRLKVSRQ